MNKLFAHKTVRFLISGGTSTAVDLILLYILTSWFGVWYLLSAVLAFVSAVWISFVMQKFWTFADRTTEQVKRQAAIYFLAAVANLGVNTLLMYSLVEFVLLPYLLAQVISSALIAVENYFIYQRFIFRSVKL